MFKRFINALKLWPEWWSIPVGLLLWIFSPDVIRFFDPVAATFDTGVLQVFLFSVIGICLFNGIVFAGIKANFPTVFKFYSTEFRNTFKELTKWQQCVYLLCLYLGLLLALVLLATTL